MALIKILQTAANKSEIFSFWYFLLWITCTLYFWKDFCSNLNDFPLIFCLSIKITNNIKLRIDWRRFNTFDCSINSNFTHLLIEVWLSDCLILFIGKLLFHFIWCCIVRLCNIIRWPVELLLLFHRLQMERLTVQKNNNSHNNLQSFVQNYLKSIINHLLMVSPCLKSTNY